MPTTTTQTKLQEELDALVERAGLQGALLVSRDGFCLMNRLAALPAAETLSAMSATLVGAAEAAFSELSENGSVRVIVDNDRLRLVAEGAGREHLVIALAPRAQALDRVVEETKATAAAVARAIQG